MIFNIITKRCSLFGLFIILTATNTVFAQGNSGNANGQPFAALQEQIDELTSRLESLESTTGLSVIVNCNSGDSIEETVLSAPRHLPINITLQGLCTETSIGTGLDNPRASVYITGEQPNDGIIVAENSTLFVLGGNRVFMNSLTIHKPNPGFAVGCFHEGSFLNAVEVTMIASSNASGYLIGDGGQCRITDSEITGAGNNGILMLRGGQLDLERTTIHNNNIGINAAQGDVMIESSTIELNNNGIFLSSGVVSRIQNSSVIDNANTGINVNNGANLSISNVSVDRNGSGINVNVGSVLASSGNFSINDNAFNGVQLSTNASAALFGSGTITGNGEFGIVCSQDTGIAHGTHAISGNGIADINCPNYIP